jgi:hypothetical protein
MLRLRERTSHDSGPVNSSWLCSRWAWPPRPPHKANAA